MKRRSHEVFNIFTLLISFNSLACTELPRNNAAEIFTLSDTKCALVKGLNPSQTYLFIDSSVERNAAFRVIVKKTNGTIVLQQDFSYAADTFDLQAHLANLGASTTLEISLIPLTSSREYYFSVVNDYDVDNNVSTLVIGLRSVVYGTNTPPCCGCCGGIQNNAFVTGSYSSSSSTTVSTLNISEAEQCNDGNRPPDSLPVDPVTGEVFNLNKMLKRYKNLKNSWSAVGSSNPLAAVAYRNFIYARALVGNLPGGYFDFSHGNGRKFYGELSTGNFVFGALLKSAGFTDQEIFRASAAASVMNWDGIDNWGELVYEGVKRYVLNYEPNGAEDIENIQKGINYTNEVFYSNLGDPSLMSCIDSKSLEQESELEDTVDQSSSDGYGGAPGGGGGEGDYSGDTSYDPGSSGGSGGGGVEWCFVDSRGIVQFCWME